MIRINGVVYENVLGCTGFSSFVEGSLIDVKWFEGNAPEILRKEFFFYEMEDLNEFFRNKYDFDNNDFINFAF